MYRVVFTKQAAKDANGQLHLKLASMEGEEFDRIKDVLSQNRGDIPVRFYPQDSKKKFLAPRGLWVSRNAAAPLTP